MTIWLFASMGVCLSLIRCAAMCLIGSAERRLVGFQMTGIIVILALVIFTVVFGRMPFVDIALTAAIMSFGGGLVFARFLEKHPLMPVFVAAMSGFVLIGDLFNLFVWFELMSTRPSPFAVSTPPSPRRSRVPSISPLPTPSQPFSDSPVSVFSMP